MAVSDAIMKSYQYDINTLAYGVRLDLNGTGQNWERIGNLSLHKTLPIQSKMRGCLLNADGSVNYYLSETSDLFKQDNVTVSILDGTDGDVMTEIPQHYTFEEIKDNYFYSWKSEFPLPGFKFIPKTYVARYKGTVNRTTGQTRSIINNSTTYRGGNNTSAWDGTSRSLLGISATNLSRQTFNNGAKLNRNINWTIGRIPINYIKSSLFTLEYATQNSQATYNSQLTAEGYKQGGLGAGVTTLDSAKWGNYNSYNPFVPCGYTAEFGNGTGYKNFTMAFEYDAGWTAFKGLWNNSTIYNANEFVADANDTSIGSGNGKLYKCILTAPAGTLLTNTTYFTLQSRTVVQVNRYRGIEIPFGKTWNASKPFLS